MEMVHSSRRRNRRRAIMIRKKKILTNAPIISSKSALEKSIFYLLLFLTTTLSVLIPNVMATTLSSSSKSSSIASCSSRRWILDSSSSSSSSLLQPLSNYNHIRLQSPSVVTTTTTFSSSPSSISRHNAFLFSLIKRRRRRRGGGDDDNYDATTSKKIIVATTTTAEDKIRNGDNVHRFISGGRNHGNDMKSNHNGFFHHDHRHSVGRNALEEKKNAGIVMEMEDPLYVGQSPPQSKDHELSSSTIEKQFTLEEINVNEEKHPKITGEAHNSSTSSSIRTRRNVQSISEGVTFKSQLREGLEEQGKLHREKLLSNLLEGVLGGDHDDSPNRKGGATTEEKVESENNPLLRWWLGLVARKEKDTDNSIDKEMRVAESVHERPKNTAVRGNIPKTSHNGSTDADSLGVVAVVNNSDKEQKSYGTFATRLISGLIMALAEEVEGLDVKVDADANTPHWNKTVHSVKIYFSRLGFRQLRMGGFVSSEFDPSSITAAFEKNRKSEGEYNRRRRPTTANEAFDTIDVDKSGALDEDELAQALTMAALIGGNNFVMRSKETLTELASRLVRLYDANGDGVVDRNEYQAMVQDMASLREARIREEMEIQMRESMETAQRRGEGNEKKNEGWLSSFFGGNNSTTNTFLNTTAAGYNVDNNIIDVTSNEEFWGSMDYGEGSIVLEGLKLDLRRLLFGFIPGVKRILPGGPLILKPFTATITASFNKDDIMDSFLLDAGLRLLVARALRRRVRGIRDLLDGAVFYGRTWKLFDKNAPDVEVLKLEDVQFDNRNRLIITGRAKIKEALGYKHEPIEQGFKLRTKIGTRANGRIIGLLQPEIAIFAECPKDLERAIRLACKEWFGYTIPVLQPVYTFIPLVSPLKKNDNMDGFNLGEDNQIKSITIKDGKLRFEISAFLRPGRFLGNHYLAFTVPNRTLILTLDRVKEGIRNARRNKRLAELAAREVKQIATAEESYSSAKMPTISPEGRARIQRLEKEMKATIQEDAILREMDEKSNKENGKSFLSRFVEGYAGAIREELDMEMNARLSTSISDFFGSQNRDRTENIN